eukprot:scaffold199376_cov25-Prasinocladus_malaysianus.AAC.1
MARLVKNYPEESEVDFGCAPHILVYSFEQFVWISHAWTAAISYCSGAYHVQHVCHCYCQVKMARFLIARKHDVDAALAMAAGDLELRGDLG